MIGFSGTSGGTLRRTTTRLLDGEFPKYRTLFPAEQQTFARVETAPLVESLKRVALVAERNTPVRLTFEDVLNRAEKASDVSPSAMAAAELLAAPPERFSFPSVRIETSASTSHNDVFARNVFRYDALTALMSVDFPLLDGGLRF